MLYANSDLSTRNLRIEIKYKKMSYCLLSLIFLILMRYCVILTNLCLHLDFMKPGQYNRFSLIW